MSVVRADYRKEFALGCERILKQQILPTIDDVNILHEYEVTQGKQDLQDPDYYSILLRLKHECEKVDEALGLVGDSEQHSLSIADQVIQFYSTNSSRWGACFGELLKDDTQGHITRVHDVTGHFALVDIMKECLDDLKSFFSRIGKAGISIRLGIATRKGALEHLRNHTRRLRWFGDDDQISITDLRRSARLQLSSTARTELIQSQPDIELRQRHTLHGLPLPYQSAHYNSLDDPSSIAYYQANDPSTPRTIDQQQYDDESHTLRRRGFGRFARYPLRLSRLVRRKVWAHGHLPVARIDLLCYAVVVSSSFCSAYACMERNKPIDSQKSDIYNGAAQAILNTLPAMIAVFNFIRRSGTQRPRLSSSKWILVCTVGGALSAIVSLLLTRQSPVTSMVFSYIANLLPMLSNFRILTYTDDS